MAEPTHDPDNEKCPWNDPETFMSPVTSGLPCTCPQKPPPDTGRGPEVVLK